MTKKNNKKIAVIGGGVMGTVLVRALSKVVPAKNIIVCEKNSARHKELRKNNSQIKITKDISDCASADVVFLAVKPQDFSNVELKVEKQTLICSIMVGISIATMQKQLKVIKVVRMMPNMAARVDEGFTAWTASGAVSTPEKKWVQNLLIQIGIELYVNSEQKIDKVTAVTGSGPAYIFNTLSVFIEATRKLGFNSKEAKQMVHQVLRGVDALSDEGVDFTELTRQVTSKGGTTEAALEVFSNSDFKKTWEKAIVAAYQRARKLSK